MKHFKLIGLLALISLGSCELSIEKPSQEKHAYRSTSPEPWLQLINSIDSMHNDGCRQLIAAGYTQDSMYGERIDSAHELLNQHFQSHWAPQSNSTQETDFRDSLLLLTQIGAESWVERQYESLITGNPYGFDSSEFHHLLDLFYSLRLARSGSYQQQFNALEADILQLIDAFEGEANEHAYGGAIAKGAMQIALGSCRLWRGIYANPPAAMGESLLPIPPGLITQVDGLGFLLGARNVHSNVWVIGLVPPPEDSEESLKDAVKGAVKASTFGLWTFK